MSNKYATTYTTNYSKHNLGNISGNQGGGVDIDQYIEKYHQKPIEYAKYRERWKNNSRNELLFLLLETTSICNLRCPMCIHGTEEGYPQCENMSDATFNLVCENIIEMNIPSISMNQINEPLTDRKIFERIRKIASLDCVVDIHMNTNAVLLNQERSKELLESGLTRIKFGFDAYYPESYEKIRKGGNFEKVLKNIMNFLELKEKMGLVFPITRISAVRLKHNEEEIERWLDFWKDKVDYVSIQEYVEPTDRNRSAEFVSSKNERKKRDLSKIACQSPFERAVVRGDGEVLPCCCMSAVKMPMGNIKNKTLREIWDDVPFRDLRELHLHYRWQENPICKNCLESSYGL